MDASLLCLAPDESARSYFRRMSRHRRRKFGVPELDDDDDNHNNSVSSHQRPPQVIEIYGESGSGKSELLVRVVTTWAMPVECGGSAAEAVYFDNDFRQSPRHLREVIERRVREEGNCCSSEASVQRLTDETMSRVKMRRCATTLEFLAALELLVNDQDNRPPPTLCVIDSLGAFFWRWEENDGAPSLAPAILRTLAKVDATIVAAKPVLFKKQRNEEYMPREWSRQVTKRLSLSNSSR